MLLNVTLPSMGKSKNLKDAVISILSNEWPLSTRQIYNKVRNNGLNVSYQAVHKAIQELIDSKILVRDGKEHELNLEWVTRIENFSKNIRKSYQTREEMNIEAVMEKGYGNFIFVNMYEFYEKMLAIIEHMQLFHMKPNGFKIGIAQLQHLYWALAGTEKIQNLFLRILSGAENYVTCEGNTHADKILAALYNDHNTKVKLNAGLNSNCDVFVMGEYIAEIYFPENTRQAIDEIYEGMKDDFDKNVKKIFENLFRKKTSINLVIFRNPLVAQQMRERTLKHFGK